MADYFDVKSRKFLREVRATEVGLYGDLPGHCLDESTSPTQYGRVHFDCTCGYMFPCEVNRSGKVVKRTRKRWEQHLESWSQDPSVVFDMGTITLVKDHVTRRIFVASRSYAEASTYVDGQYSYWTKPAYNGEHEWAVLQSGDGQRKVLKTAISKEMAFTAALQVLDLAETRGSKVYRQVDAFNLPDSDTIRTVTATLLGLNDDAELDELQQGLAALDALLALVPHLEQKRSQLREARELRLLGPLAKVSW